MSEILNVLKNYDFFSPVDTVERISGGNINETYKIVTSDREKFILQRINDNVFPDVEALMRNMMLVTEKLRNEKNKKSLDKMHVLNIKFTRDSKTYCKGERGFYRLFDFMAETKTIASTNETEKITGAGYAFGQFSSMLNDGDFLELTDVIKDFHNTPLRLKKLEESYKKCPKTRKNKGKEVAEYLLSKKNEVKNCVKTLRALPLRIVHNDTKISNVAFDVNTGDAVGVLDLDTVMNGYLLYDFGDGARSIAGPCREDESDLSCVSFNMEKFDAFSKGYIDGIMPFATDCELLNLALGVKLITIELSARFLTDYFDGDKYFKIEYDEQNLYRAKCQSALLKDIENKYYQINKCLKTRINDKNVQKQRGIN